MKHRSAARAEFAHMPFHAVRDLVFVRDVHKAKAQGVGATGFRLIAFKFGAGDSARRE